MKKISTFKYLISLLILFIGLNSNASSYVSLTPNITEIIYALNAQDNLIGVSSVCDFPFEATKKGVVGDTYFVNMEKIVKLKPDYLFTLKSAKPMLGELSLTQTEPIYFEFNKIEDLYSAITKIGKLTEKENNASRLIKNIKEGIEKNKTKNPKRILYLVQLEPLITIGKNSFITDEINLSGHTSISQDLKYSYPNITIEYAIKTKPDIIILNKKEDISKIKKLFPNTKFMYLKKGEQDIINRCGPRIIDGIKLFAQLNFDSI